MTQRSRDAKELGGPTQGGRPTLPIDCGDFEIRIGADGTWYYRGSPIGRKPLVRLFASVLSRDEAGTYWLTTPVERGRIEVEDSPFIAVEVNVAGSGRGQSLILRTNLDEEVEVGPEHPIRVDLDPVTGEPRPYILVKGRLEARILRPVYYHLVELGGEESIGDKPTFGVWSKNTFWPLGSLEAPS
ncbi:MAG: DUF1285 domain-containing protein [Proteobacteria bacterium]|nr:DUF1285 domain-containing protein [Pseudomonadota bacterium]MBI3497590.1 DUF1285 domain-containing protein [Pseudomonadota bacterium]